VRRAVTALVIAWAALAVVDHSRVLVATIREPPANPIRDLVNGLVERQVPVASAGYWRAYVITFVAQERVRVAANDFIRVQEYQDLFAERPGNARVIADRPCPGGESVAGWYLCPPD
jgi:hypothetical protein